VRFLLDAHPRAGLNVIGEIPDGRVQQIEGRNGVGKTLAVRLLQLCTGTQPYLGKASAWTSLRQYLGPVVITVEGLRDGHELIFRLNPDGWPDAPEPPGEWLGLVELDGSPFVWRDVPDLLRVSRIGGDETLGESLAAGVAEDLDRVRQLGLRQERRRKGWDTRVARLLRLTEVPAVLDLAGLENREARAVRELNRASQESEKVEVLDRAARQVVSLLTKAQLVKARQPELEEQVLSLAEAERRLRRQIEELDRAAAELLSADKSSSGLLKTMDDLARKQRLRRERRERRRRELAAASAEAGVEVPIDLIAVDSLTASLTDDLEAMDQERLTLDRSGLLLEVISEVERPVARAAASGLGGEPVAQLPAGPLTAAELLDGVSRRRMALVATPSGQATALHSRIEQTRHHLQAAERLPTAVRLLAKAEADLRETQGELNKALKAFTVGAADSYQQVNDERAVLLDDLTATVEDRSGAEQRLADLLADGGAQDLIAQAALLAAGSGDSANPPDLATAQSLAAATSVRLDEAKAVVLGTIRARDQATRELDDARTAVRAACDELERAPEHRWLTASISGLQIADARSEDQAQILSRLHAAASKVDDWLLQTYNDLQALEEALLQLEGRLRASGTAGNLDAGRSLTFTQQVQRLYADRFAEEFGQAELRDALFAGGTDVHFDLLDMTTSWVSPDGHTQTRPLEAFSSGERAFAYTRVKLEQLKMTRSRNRVVFLDEFGAFVARDRFDLLLTYLRNQALGRIADQVVLVLPLREHPGADQKDELDRRRGYLVRELW
jgi:hypothetical protein